MAEFRISGRTYAPVVHAGRRSVEFLGGCDYSLRY
jgi:hypothetical protein